jgi:hypothetical protein
MTGPKRINASLEWKAQVADVWDIAEATYADVNGNGVVEPTDVLGVALNWLKTHAVNTTTGASGAPPLSLSAVNHAQYLEAYLAMYRVLENAEIELTAGCDENITQVKQIVSQAISMGIRQKIHATSELMQNYPNPFNPATWIPYILTEKAYVIIKIYNMSGQLIRVLDLGEKEAGMYVSKERAAFWDGLNDKGEEVASGVYFYQIHAGDYVSTKKMVVIK